MEKTVLITGGTSGVGKATVEALAAKGMKVIMLARNTEKAEKVILKIKAKNPDAQVSFLEADLNHLQSVDDAAERFVEENDTLDILINNAGGIFNDFEKTKDNFEWAFQINHLSHFLLTKKLLPLLLKSTEPKVISLSSEAHQMGKYEADNLNGEKKFGGWRQYGATKLMNILFTKSLKDHHAEQGLQAYAVHPGVVKTGFGSNNGGLLKYFSWMPFLISPEEGAQTSIHLATTPADKLKNGFYYKKSKPANVSQAAINEDYRADLWQQSERMLSEKGFHFS